MSTLYGRIKQARLLERKMSQAEFSDKIGVTQRSYSRYELGQTVPDAEIVKKISDITGVAIQWLLTGEGPIKTGKDGETYLFEHYVKPIHGSLSSKDVGPCLHCLELYEKLDIRNERLFKSSERERVLLKEVGDLKEKIGGLNTELAELKNKQSTDYNGNSNNNSMPSAS